MEDGPKPMGFPSCQSPSLCDAKGGWPFSHHGKISAEIYLMAIVLSVTPEKVHSLGGIPYEWRSEKDHRYLLLF